MDRQFHFFLVLGQCVLFRSAEGVMVNGVFQPEELRLLRYIFDESVSDLPPHMRTSVNQARIAKQILDCAATGERDPIELRMAAALNDTRAA